MNYSIYSKIINTIDITIEIRTNYNIRFNKINTIKNIININSRINNIHINIIIKMVKQNYNNY